MDLFLFLHVVRNLVKLRTFLGKGLVRRLLLWLLEKAIVFVILLVGIFRKRPSLNLSAASHPSVFFLSDLRITLRREN